LHITKTTIADCTAPLISVRCWVITSLISQVIVKLYIMYFFRYYSFTNLFWPLLQGHSLLAIGITITNCTAPLIFDQSWVITSLIGYN